MRLLNVWWEGRLVGELTQDKGGDLGFRYATDWLSANDAPALSISLPKRVEPFSRHECRPFFAGLLPDENQRNVAAKALGVSEANDFALLNEMGGDVAGALELLPPEATSASSSYSPQTTALTDDAFIAVLDALPSHPLLAGETGLRLSLAGAQSKIPVVLIDGAIALPAPGQPTTHILKPPIVPLRATTENEAAVMRLARAIGLDAAHIQPRIVQNRPFLLIERYDRERTADGTIRLHQEDFCQALGIPPDHKYAAEGGPVFKDCFDLVRRVSTRPAQDVLKLLDAALFNLIVGNADAHGKNFSLLYSNAGVRFAPLYDLLSTVQYPNLSSNLAMKIGKAGTLQEIGENSWSRFAGESGVTVTYLRRRTADLIDRVRKNAREACADAWITGLDERIFSALAEDIVRRADLLALKLPKGSAPGLKAAIAKGIHQQQAIEISVGNHGDLSSRKPSTTGGV